MHVNTALPASMVPIDGVAVGDPASILPPDQHEQIWTIARFPGTRPTGHRRVSATGCGSPKATD